MTYYISKTNNGNRSSHLTYGPVPRKRTKRLLEALISYANDEYLLPDSLRSKIRIYWQNDQQLVVETTVRALEGLTHYDDYQGQLNTDQIKTSIKLLENFLGILIDNRSQPRGSNKWYFTIHFWFSRYNKVGNLERFEQNWERLQPAKSKQVTGNTLDLLEISKLNSLSNRIVGPYSEITTQAGISPDYIDTQQTIYNSEDYSLRYSDRHGIIKALGMRQPIHLEDLYISVQILDSDLISNYKSIERLEEDYRNRKTTCFEDRSNERQPGLKIANNYPYLMVLGGPGTGKSTFLRKMGQEALKGSSKSNYIHDCIPVFIELKKFCYLEVDIEAAIIHEFKICGLSRPQKFVNEFLAKGKLLVLLDGLDEVPAEKMGEAVTKIQDFANQFHCNRFIISCRTAAYRYNLRNFTDVAIAEFDDIQIQQFIKNWFREYPKKIFTFWNQLNSDRNKSIKELARSPLLLTLLCLIYQREDQCPSHRASLYDKALWILLDGWDAEKDVPRENIYKGLATKQKEKILSQVAFDAFTNDKLFLQKRVITQQLEKSISEILPEVTFIDGTQVLKSIELQHGLLVERVEGIYSFSHLTIQEYLTALYIISHSENNYQLLQQIIENHLIDARWQEVFLLLAGMMRVDNLIYKMEKIALKFIDQSPSIKFLMYKVDQMTIGTIGDFKPAAKRAAAIALFFPRVHKFGTITRFTNHQDSLLKETLFTTYNLAHELTSILTEKRLLVQALDRIRITDDAIYCGIECTHKNAFMRAIKNSMISAQKFKEAKIFNEADISSLLDNLEASKKNIPNSEKSFEVNRQFARSFQQMWLDAFWMDPELINFSNEELDSLNNYLKVNILIVKCIQSAIFISQSAWRTIESRMLTII